VCTPVSSASRVFGNLKKAAKPEDRRTDGDDPSANASAG
jgi:hypothetical protein